MTIATYQPANGAGAAAMNELVQSTRAYLNGEVYPPKVMPHPYAFNLFSHNTAVDPETGYNDEEGQGHQTRKIFEVNGSASASPAYGCRCCGRIARPLPSKDRFRKPKSSTFWRWRPACASWTITKNYFPMPVDAPGQDDVLAGRIRKDLGDPTGHSISMFVAADQLLKGAALNAVQIAELLPERVMREPTSQGS